MPFREYLADRVRERLPKAFLVEKKMMGGLVFMVNGKMCIGLVQDKTTKKDRLMVRVGKANYESLLSKSGAQKMDFTGREMKGFIFIYSEGYDSDSDLDFWVKQALDFNALL